MLPPDLTRQGGEEEREAQREGPGPGPSPQLRPWLHLPPAWAPEGSGQRRGGVLSASHPLPQSVSSTGQANGEGGRSPLSGGLGSLSGPTGPLTPSLPCEGLCRRRAPGPRARATLGPPCCLPAACAHTGPLAGTPEIQHTQHIRASTHAHRCMVDVLLCHPCACTQPQSAHMDTHAETRVPVLVDTRAKQHTCLVPALTPE